MLFGTREAFDYFECAECGCVQIVSPPEDMSAYYPNNYYSLNRLQEPVRKTSPLILFIKARRLNSFLGNPDPLGKLFRLTVGDAWFSEIEKDHVPLRADYRILDVGCGDGHRLARWYSHGFRHLHGIDPHIAADVVIDTDFKLSKATLTELEGVYDFIMAHHSLEHMWDQQAMVDSIARLLKPGGYAEIALPVASSDAWKKYRENWFALDPPRHYFLHTFDSLKLVAGRAGLELRTIVHDSSSKEIWASEQYAKDIPLFDDRSHEVNPEGSIFSEDDIRRFSEEVDKLNKEGRSQQARFFFFKRD